METFQPAGISKLTVCASLVASLAACGGGGSGSSGVSATGTAGTAGSAGNAGGAGSGTSSSGSGGSSIQATQITGKAIDGYLAGATVCVDNGQGVCDTTQPTATTDASGNYSLSVNGAIAGKIIDVLVTTTTTDASNNNATFANTFTLSAVLQAGTTQNVTPITSLVAAQVKAGLSYAQAASAVQAVTGANVDPSADYVANGDSGTASLSAKVVSTMQNYASGGAVNPATARNVLNAIVATGDPAAVTPATVFAQANASATPVDAATALSNSLYVVEDLLQGVSTYTAGDATGGPAENLVLRDSYTLSNSVLTIGQDQFVLPNGAWTPVSPAGLWDGYRDTQLDATLFTGVTGIYEMKADGTWTPFLANSQLHPAIQLSSTNGSLLGTDPNTNIGYQLQYRQTDVSGQPLSSAVPFYDSLGDGNPVSANMKGVFASGTTEYLGNATHTSDQVILPVDSDTVQLSIYGNDTTSDFGEGITINGNAVSDPNNLGKVGHTYTSVQQVIGIQLGIGIPPSDGSTGGKLVLTSDGHFQMTGLPVYTNYADASAGTTHASTTINLTGTWATYSRNPNVLVLSFPADFKTPIYSQDNVTEAILHGANFVIALQNGRLKSGFLIPAANVEVTPQFVGSIADQISASLAAGAASQNASQASAAAAQLHAVGHFKR